MFQLGDLKVKKLSGPISFRYLLPKKEVFLTKAAENVFLPIVILLGDEHTEALSCDPCQEEKGCYDVSSQTFLKSLNTIARQIPIDMYTEYSDSLTIDHAAPGLSLFGNFLQQTLSCHKKADRTSGLFDCKFPNLRWHYADSRKWGKVEKAMHDGMQYLTSIDTFLQPNTTDNEMLHHFVNVLAVGAEENQSFDQVILKWAGILSEFIIGNPDSLVYKQLAKYQIDINVELYIYTSLKASFAAINPGKKIDKLKVEEFFGGWQYLNAIGYYMTKGPLTEEDDMARMDAYLSIIARLRVYWPLFTASLLDLYFIGRMFKPPKDNINSYVTVAYFGDEHCANISNCLTISQDWYELKHAVKRSCIMFRKDVNFNDDLRKYTVLRQKVQKVQPYLDQIQRELSGREQSRKLPHMGLIKPFQQVTTLRFSEETALLIYEYVKKLIALMTPKQAGDPIAEMRENIRKSGNVVLIQFSLEKPFQKSFYEPEWVAQLIHSAQDLSPRVVRFTSDMMARLLIKLFQDLEDVVVSQVLTPQDIQAFAASDKGKYLRF